MNQPNIIFFMLDQLAAKWLDAALDGACLLPNLARLRGSGTTFTNVITSNPVCCPTRATLATGLTSHGHGVLENGYQLDPALPTFMRALQAAGYRTGAFGKVHFQPHFRGFWPDYQQYGFDVTHLTEDARGGQWLDWVMREHPQHLESVLATIWAWPIPEFAAYGPDKINLQERIRHLRETFDWATPRFGQNTIVAHTLPFPEEVSQTNWITGHALGYLRDTPRDQPLFAQISYVQPHSPFCAPESYMDQVETRRIPAPVPPNWAGEPPLPRYLQTLQALTRTDYDHARHLYFADLVHLDRQLGLVVSALEETKRMANTYLVFLSDHGEMLGDHGMWGKESKHYDACIRVPLTIAGPGLRRGATCDEMIQLEDICPTVLEMGSVNLPPMPRLGPYLKLRDDEIATLPGHSLLPLCRNANAAFPRRAAYTESFNAIWSNTPEEWARTIRTRDHRYTFYANNGGDQLFDLPSDPDEQRSLVADPAFAAIRQALRDQLLEMIVLQDFPKTRRDLFALGVH